MSPYGLLPTRLLYPWNFLGKNTGVGCHFLLQGMFLTQGLNPGLPHCRQILYRLSHQRSTKRCYKKHYVNFPSQTHKPTHSWAARLDSGASDVDSRATRREAATTPCGQNPEVTSALKVHPYTLMCAFKHHKAVLRRQVCTLNTKFRSY